MSEIAKGFKEMGMGALGKVLAVRSRNASTVGTLFLLKSPCRQYSVERVHAAQW